MAQVLKDEIKEKIQNSAVDIFTLKGYKKASIKEIAMNANVSVGNVYRYYKNKEELYESVIKGVYDSINKLMNLVEKDKNYQMDCEGEPLENHMYDPLMIFIEIYRRDKKIFTMLLKSEKDNYYEKTIVSFIDTLRNYFLRFWGEDQQPNGLSFNEVSALTNALVFSVIDLLNRVEEEQLEVQLTKFVPRIIKGYFMAKNSREEQ